MVLTEGQFLAVVREKESSALLFVHGFNCDFAGPIFRLAQILFDADYRGVPAHPSHRRRGNQRYLKANGNQYEKGNGQAKLHPTMSAIMSGKEESVTRRTPNTERVGSRILSCCTSGGRVRASCQEIKGCRFYPRILSPEKNPPNRLDGPSAERLAEADCCSRSRRCP